MLVQNRVAIAQPQLPDEVQRNGVVTRKNSPDILMVVFMLSPDDTFDQLYISNYALLQVRDQLLRIDGVGDIQIFGARDYSMRLWLDPDRIANLGLTSTEVLAAIRAQNVQIAGGQIAEPPIADRAFQPNLIFTGRLKDQKQFEDILIKAGSDGRTVRLRDVARIELGALAYSTNSFLLRKSAVAMLVTQRPGSNALATAKNISDTMTTLKESFPKGLDYNIGYNPTEFIAQSRPRADQDHLRGHAARGHRGAGVPARMAARDHSDHRDPGLAGRHLRGDGGARLLHQQPHACSASCLRSASWSTTPSWWWRMSSAISSTA